jgi:hypothetical protein
MCNSIVVCDWRNQPFPVAVLPDFSAARMYCIPIHPPSCPYFWVTLSLFLPFPTVGAVVYCGLESCLAVWGRGLGYQEPSNKHQPRRGIVLLCFFWPLNYHAWISALKHLAAPGLDFGAWSIFTMFKHWKLHIKVLYVIILLDCWHIFDCFLSTFCGSELHELCQHLWFSV